jgi:hypothetical protein
MSKIPLRALNRPRSGKHAIAKSKFAPVASLDSHPGELAPEGAAPAPEAEQALEPAPVPEAEQAPEPALDLFPDLNEGVAPVPEPAPPIAPIQAWDSTWTKAQLLAAAQAKGLPVTQANTKAEIIAALTAAG